MSSTLESSDPSTIQPIDTESAASSDIPSDSTLDSTDSTNRLDSSMSSFSSRERFNVPRVSSGESSSNSEDAPLDSNDSTTPSVNTTFSTTPSSNSSEDTLSQEPSVIPSSDSSLTSESNTNTLEDPSSLRIPDSRTSNSTSSGSNTALDDRILPVNRQLPLVAMSINNDTITTTTNTTIQPPSSMIEEETPLKPFTTNLTRSIQDISGFLPTVNSSNHLNLRQPSGQASSTSDTTSTNNIPLVIGVSIGGLLLLVIGAMLIYWKRQKMNRRKLMDPYGNPYAIEGKREQTSWYNY